MTAPLTRSPFTDMVLTVLRTTGFVIGDGQIPPGVNWRGGVYSPGSTFTPYAVVSEIVASHSTGPIADTQADWQLPYLVESFGITRTQCDALADRLLAALAVLRIQEVTVGSVSYRFQQVRLDSAGSPARVDSLEPAVWHRQDGITVWMGKDS